MRADVPPRAGGALQTNLWGREVEATALSKGAALLIECHDHWNAVGRDQRLDDALSYNQLVWTIIRSELGNPSGSLPLRLREDLVRLAQFIERRISDITEYPDREKLSAIIRINLHIAAGLRGIMTD